MAPRPATHGITDTQKVTDFRIPTKTEQESRSTYTFENFFHPFVGELLAKLNKESLPGMLDPNYHDELEDDPDADFFARVYRIPDDDKVAVDHSPTPKKIDTEGGSYAVYNWELFFHIPLAIAVHLSKNQRFAEAQRWFHFIFDPTANDPSPDPPALYWRFIAFRRAGTGRQIDGLLGLLSKPDTELTQTERELAEDVLERYEGILDNPFQPHVVARPYPAPGLHVQRRDEVPGQPHRLG